MAEMWPPPERKRVVGTRSGASAPRSGGEGLLKEAEQGSPSVALGGKQQHHLGTCQESGSWGARWGMESVFPGVPVSPDCAPRPICMSCRL